MLKRPSGRLAKSNARFFQAAFRFLRVAEPAFGQPQIIVDVVFLRAGKFPLAQAVRINRRPAQQSSRLLGVAGRQRPLCKLRQRQPVLGGYLAFAALPRMELSAQEHFERLFMPPKRIIQGDVFQIQVIPL